MSSEVPKGRLRIVRKTAPKDSTDKEVDSLTSDFEKGMKLDESKPEEKEQLPVVEEKEKPQQETPKKKEDKEVAELEKEFEESMKLKEEEKKEEVVATCKRCCGRCVVLCETSTVEGTPEEKAKTCIA